ncbi:MAG: hypothetical protein K2Z81_05215, partial [Cyanobacteria bacterium]|nr:hypothetical protein [Cyanobacteriota bacterium]
MKHAGLISAATLLAVVLCNSLPSVAKDESRKSDEKSTRDDVVFSALIDEMERSKKSMRTESYPLPYFVSYWVKEIDEMEISSCLGSKSDVFHSRTRILIPSTRLGTPDLDSSVPGTSRPDSVTQIPVDDDYPALRKAVWLATDRAYKYAIRMFEWKKAYLSKYSLPNRLPDLTEEKPVVSVDAKAPKPLSIDEKRWCATVQRL